MMTIETNCKTMIPGTGWTYADAQAEAAAATIERYRFETVGDRVLARYEDVPALMPGFDGLVELGADPLAVASALDAGLDASLLGFAIDAGLDCELFSKALSCGLGVPEFNSTLESFGGDTDGLNAALELFIESVEDEGRQPDPALRALSRFGDLDEVEWVS